VLWRDVRGRQSMRRLASPFPDVAQDEGSPMFTKVKLLSWRGSDGGGSTSAPKEETLNQKQDNCSDDRCDQFGAVLRLVPSCLLSEIRGCKGAYDAKKTGQYEPEWSLSAG
jgi:hypothetical protein